MKQKLKIALAEIKPFKEAIKILKDIKQEMTFKVEKEYMELYEMDYANVLGVYWKLLNSCCVEWDCEEQSFSLNIENLYNILKNGKQNDMLLIENSEEKNHIDLVFKSHSTRRYSLPLIELDKPPNQITDLKFKAKIVIDSKRFYEQIKEADNTADSVCFIADSKRFNIIADADLSKLQIENKQSDDTKITAEKEIKAKYSVEYLKKITPAFKIADDVTLEFDNNYPLSVVYSTVDKQQFKFILAPRVESD